MQFRLNLKLNPKSIICIQKRRTDKWLSQTRAGPKRIFINTILGLVAQQRPTDVCRTRDNTGMQSPIGLRVPMKAPRSSGRDIRR